MNNPKVLNIRKDYADPNSVKVDRSTPYGNPFHLGQDGNRDEVCDKFEKWVFTQPELIARAKIELKGKNLLCWCAPLRCHAETWLRIVNE